MTTIVRPKIDIKLLPALERMSAHRDNITRLINELIEDEIRTVEFVPSGDCVIVRYNSEPLEMICKDDPEFDEKLIGLKNKYLKY